MTSDNQHLKGTTTVGIACSDAVVLATERRATMGNFIASKTAKKIYQIDDRIGMTTAGSVGDAQQIVRIISVEAKLFKMRRKEPMTIKGITTLLSNLLSGQRYFPLMVQLIVGGVDKTGPNMYSLDPLGGRIEETNIVATGSGSPITYGLLEDRYHEGMTSDEGIDLAVRALHNAMKRDSASGDGIDVVVITKDGYKQLNEKEVNNKRAALN
ncbi:MAG: archaeal proteasome endopeptidase complex subunit beta [Methanohalobium sp.]|uniref:archaeal proteasome endopeptidase complex subunit beta n=1 Tax=Methanohalobium sp. TaxID=2837493 RepID=UPI00397E37B9